MNSERLKDILEAGIKQQKTVVRELEYRLMDRERELGRAKWGEDEAWLKISESLDIEKGVLRRLHDLKGEKLLNAWVLNVIEVNQEFVEEELKRFVSGMLGFKK